MKNYCNILLTFLILFLLIFVSCSKTKIELDKNFYTNWNIKAIFFMQNCCDSYDDTQIEVFKKNITVLGSNILRQEIGSRLFENTYLFEGDTIFIKEVYIMGNQHFNYKVTLFDNSQKPIVGFQKKMEEKNWSKIEINNLVKNKLNWRRKCCINGILNVRTHPITVQSQLTIANGKLKLIKVNTSIS